MGKAKRYLSENAGLSLGICELMLASDTDAVKKAHQLRRYVYHMALAGSLIVPHWYFGWRDIL